MQKSVLVWFLVSRLPRKLRFLSPVYFYLLVNLVLVSLLQAQPLANKRFNEELQWLQQENSIVTADRYVRSIETTAANVTIINAEAIERSAALNVPDLLRYVSGVEVQANFGNEKKTNVSIRGYGFNADQSTLVLIDGRRVNGPKIHAINWTSIPLERIERIEIVRGGNSGLYGDKAVSGIINIITKKGSIEKQLTTGLKTGSFDYVSPYFDYSDSSAFLDGVLSYSINASYMDSNGYRDNEDIRNKTAGIGLNFEKHNFSLSLSGGGYSSSNGIPGPLTEQQYKHAPTHTNVPGRSQEDDEFYLQIFPSYKLSSDSKISAMFNYSKFDTTVAQRETENLELSPQFVSRNNLFGFSNQLLLGIDIFQIRSNLAHFDITKKTKAFYINHSSGLWNDSLFIDLNLRHDWITDKRENFDRKKYSIPSTKVGINWNYAEKSKLFFSFDRSFRTSHFDFITAQTNNWVADDVQVSKQYQIGFSHFFEPGIAVKGTLFRIDTDDEILYEPYNNLFVNYERTRRKGLELEFHYAIEKNLNLFFNYSYMDGKFIDGGYSDNRLPNIPRHSGSFGLSYLINAAWSFDIKARWAEDKIIDDDWLNQAEWDDDYFVSDISFNYQIRNFRINLGINNIFDEQYVEYANANKIGKVFYFPRPERNFVLGIEYKY